MKKYFQIVLVSLSITFITSCDDDELSVLPPRGSIEEYLDVNDVSGHTLTESGIYYKVLGSGNGTSLIVDDIVDFNAIVLTMENDTITTTWQDTTATWTTSLNSTISITIPCIVEVLSYVQLQDSVELLVPSEMAWGESGVNGFVRVNEDVRLIIKPERTRQTIPEYLEENEITGFSITPNEVYYIYHDGKVDGDFPKDGDILEVHYHLTNMETGEVVDSSIEKNQTFRFILGTGAVIAGWDEAFKFFPKGQKGSLFVPYDMAYGVWGSSSGGIGAYDNLRFDVEVIDIQ